MMMFNMSHQLHLLVAEVEREREQVLVLRLLQEFRVSTTPPLETDGVSNQTTHFHNTSFGCV